MHVNVVSCQLFCGANTWNHINYLDLIEVGGQSHSVTYRVNSWSPLMNLRIWCHKMPSIWHHAYNIWRRCNTSLAGTVAQCNRSKKFSLNKLNSLLRTHNYSPSEEKPSPLSHDTGSFHIKQSGTYYCVNKNYTSSLIFSFSNDDSYVCFLSLLEIW